MVSFSIFHWVIVAIIVSLPGWLFSKIFHKAGFSPWRALLLYIPVVGVVTFWSFAFSKWPAQKK